MKLLVREDNNHIEGFCEFGGVEATEGYKIVEIESVVENPDTLLLSTYEDGKIVYHPEWLEEEQKQEELAEMKREQEAILAQIQKKSMLRSLDDKQAFSVRLLYDDWNQNGVKYLENDRVMYLGKFWKCLSDHTSSATLKPTDANYLWVEIADPSIEYPEWKQPLGYADAYKKGAKVTFKGKKYVSLIDGNTYSPEAYPDGWDEVN